MDKIYSMSDYLDINNEELLKDFFSEAEQQVEKLESNILVIENNPSDVEAIDEIFRAAHTLKGGSATVEMHELSGFTHVVEDVLDELRSGTIKITEEVINILLASIDVIKFMLQERANGSTYIDDVDPLKAQLRSLLPGKSAQKPVAKKVKPKANVTSVDVNDSPLEGISEYELLELKNACAKGESLWAVIVIFDESNPMNTVGGIQVFATLKNRAGILKTTPDFDSLYADEFHPKVVYFVSTTLSGDELEDIAFLSDVVLATRAQALDEVADDGKVGEKKTMQTVHLETKQELLTDTVVAEQKKVVVQKPEKKSVAPVSSHTNTGSILRVDSKRIDYLLNLVSEAVITKASFNQATLFINDLQSELQSIETAYKEDIRKLFEQLPLHVERVQSGELMRDVKASLVQEFGHLYTMFDNFDTQFKNTSAKFRAYTQNLGRITGELQEGVMKIRMVPISQIFSRFPRVVRDLSRDLDKKISLEIEGEETELDKSVIEDLLDPIMHCVRNSIDHGIEIPSQRRALGKAEEGTLLLKASNEGNMIVIEVHDDGRGIDVDAVREKAIERGLIHPGKMMTDQEAFQLIFDPGFSTAKEITNVSGRGVGLDVVKTQIEKLNGTVLVSSEKNVGSVFSIRLPLTLAIIQGLLVRVSNEVYSIPIASVIESQRIQRSEIKRIDNYEVLNVRNEVISVLRLSRLFGLKNADDGEYNFIVIVGTSDKKIGIMVDSLIGEEDIVIKPLKDQYTNSPGIAGASILGDGSVSLIIDVSQLLELGVKQELSERDLNTVATN